MMRIGPDLRESHRLDDGTAVTLRLIRPDDRDALKRAILDLSPESLHARFFVALRNPSDAMLTYLTEVDGIDHLAIVAIGDSFDLKTDRPMGVARFIRRKDEPDTAEAAVTVVDSAQGKGLGKLLLKVLAEAARERGITKFRGETLASNAKVRAILDEVGAEVRETEDGTIAFQVRIPENDDASLFHALVGGFLRFVGPSAT